MAQTKHYGSPYDYEKKLKKVMERLGAGKFNYDWNRYDCFIEFYYKEGFYRFEHSVKKSLDSTLKLQYGSDAFAQLVLALEDLARLVERGIYELSTWVSGLKALPAATTLPKWANIMQLHNIPNDFQETKKHYKKLVHDAHPDKGGSEEKFTELQDALAQAKAYYDEYGNGD